MPYGGGRAVTSTDTPVQIDTDKLMVFVFRAVEEVGATDESSPAFPPGLFQIAHGTVRDALQITEAARRGTGLGWHRNHHDVHLGCERFFRPEYTASLINVLAARPGRRGRQAAARRQCSRRGIRAWRLHRADGPGL